MKNSEWPEEIVSQLAAKTNLTLLTGKKPKLNVIFIKNPQLISVYEQLSRSVELGFGYFVIS